MNSTFTTTILSFESFGPFFYNTKMIYDFICGVPVGDLLAIIYYVKRQYFKNDPYYIYSPKFHSLIEDLVEAKGIP